MKNIWKIVGVMFFAIIATATFGQTDSRYESGDDEDAGDPFEESWTDKLVYGGDMLPGYSNGWFLYLTPMIGYKVTETTVAGVGINYSYRDFRNPYTLDRAMWRTYGGRAFVMQDLMYGIFGQVEYDYRRIAQRQTDRFDNVFIDYRGQAPGLLIGGGYGQRGDRFSYNFTVMYDVFYDGNLLHQRPNSFGAIVARGGVIFGL